MYGPLPHAQGAGQCLFRRFSKEGPMERVPRSVARRSTTLPVEWNSRMSVELRRCEDINEPRSPRGYFSPYLVVHTYERACTYNNNGCDVTASRPVIHISSHQNSFFSSLQSFLKSLACFFFFFPVGVDARAGWRPRGG